MRAYLDYNATAPLRPEARAATLAALESCGNPSSIHAEGRAARALIEEARRQVAALCRANARDVVFTSGGTETAALALAPSGGLARLIVSAGEHPCVLAGHRFAQAEIAPLGADGRVDLPALKRLLDGPPALVALQAANNETGVIQPVAEAAALAHARGGRLVCDAAQAAGRVPLDAFGDADALILSAHKFGGPKGAGALVLLREGFAPAPLLRGGGQERGRRAGTENVAALAGFGAAATAALEEARLAALRDACEAALPGDAVIFGAAASRLPNTLAFAIPGLPAATLLMRLDLDGVAVSSGSACSSGKVSPSHVLAAMGVAPALAAGAIRVSLGWGSSCADVEAFAAALDKAAARRRV
jgi:cysteine desulfurase